MKYIKLWMCGATRIHTEESIREMGLGMFPELQYQFPHLFTSKEKSWFTKEEKALASNHKRVKRKRRKRVSV
jgi:hypothetical protein